MAQKRKEFRVINGERCWQCPKCIEWKAEHLFGVDSNRWNGVDGICRGCRSIDNAKRYRRSLDRNRESGRIRRTKYRAANPERARFAGVKWRAENLERARFLARASYSRNKDRARAYNKAYMERFPQKIKAKDAVRYAIKSGGLTRPDRCEMCGGIREIQGHHDSYDRDRWLIVTWLCRSCHQFLHAKRRENSGNGRV